MEWNCGSYGQNTSRVSVRQTEQRRNISLQWAKCFPRVHLVDLSFLCLMEIFRFSYIWFVEHTFLCMVCKISSQWLTMSYCVLCEPCIQSPEGSSSVSATWLHYFFQVLEGFKVLQALLFKCMMSEDLWLTFFPLERSSERTFTIPKRVFWTILILKGEKKVGVGNEGLVLWGHTLEYCVKFWVPPFRRDI